MEYFKTYFYKYLNSDGFAARFGIRISCGSLNMISNGNRILFSVISSQAASSPGKLRRDARAYCNLCFTPRTAAP